VYFSHDRVTNLHANLTDWKYKARIRWAQVS